MRNIVEKPIIYPIFLYLLINKLLTTSNYLEIINIFCFEVLLKNTVTIPDNCFQWQSKTRPLISRGEYYL